MTSRRAVLQMAMASGAATVFSGLLGGVKAFAASAPVVRRSLHGMAENDPDLAAYRDFVRIMQAYDDKSPLSWLGYSLQHGRYNGNYKYCPHGDWYFLPWHREFVLMYERAVRVVTSTPGFAMPYWDWALDRAFPAQFANPKYQGQANALYVPTRTLNTANWPLSDSVVGPKVIDSIFQETDFQLFGTSRNPAQNNLDMSWVVAGKGTQGVLERNCHNNIHNYIGGFMPTAGSPRDPVFMMHHSNIDRIWVYWNALGRSNTAGMSASDQNLWLNMNFKDNYLSPVGKTYSAIVRDLQDNVALGFTYPDLPRSDGRKADPERAKRLLDFFAAGEGAATLTGLRVLSDSNRLVARASAPLVKEVRLPQALRKMALETAADAPQAAEVFALIKDMVVGPDVQGVRVFVNAGAVSADTPDSDPHFVTTIGILAHGDGGSDDHGAHHKGPPSALVDLTDALRRLGELKLIKDDSVSVHLLPVLRPGASDGAGATLVPAEVEIAIL